MIRPACKAGATVPAVTLSFEPSVGSTSPGPSCSRETPSCSGTHTRAYKVSFLRYFSFKAICSNQATCLAASCWSLGIRVIKDDSLLYRLWCSLNWLAVLWGLQAIRTTVTRYHNLVRWATYPRILPTTPSVRGKLLTQGLTLLGATHGNNRNEGHVLLWTKQPATGRSVAIDIYA